MVKKAEGFKILTDKDTVPISRKQRHRPVLLITRSELRVMAFSHGSAEPRRAGGGALAVASSPGWGTHLTVVACPQLESQLGTQTGKDKEKGPQKTTATNKHEQQQTHQEAVKDFQNLLMFP